MECHVYPRTRSKEPSRNALQSHSAGQETRQDKLKQITELVFSFLFQHNNGQQEAID